ncbi:MAG TPA: CPBP family intramembrane glutamic endopeptidase [Rhizomicrobium sp.]|nr:CPBP family intramembrane glutamic endopeptidase [Rhizomicrobium sp.]
MTKISDVFRGSDGKLRPIFRALLYAVLAFWLLSADWLVGPVLQRTAVSLGLTGLSPGRDAFYETVNLLTALLLTWGFALYEGRRVDSYGLPVGDAFGKRFREGFAIGVVNVGAVALAMLAFGGMTIHGLALHGTTLLWATLAWFGSNILVGIAEEYLFRGYLLQTLWRSVGFWPAAAIIALWFGADHYFFKQGENAQDLILLVSVGLWLCYSVRRTGTLWLAAGYHAAFDFMQLFVIGTPNGSIEPVHHLLNVSFQGPAWISGGALGVEASFFEFPLIALMFFYLWRRRFVERSQSPPLN